MTFHTDSAVRDSDRAAVLLLSNDDAVAFFWPLFRDVSTPPPDEINGMPVRTVGVIGRTGEQASVALSEPLGDSLAESIEQAWEAYCKTVNSFEIAELERILALPDNRR